MNTEPSKPRKKPVRKVRGRMLRTVVVEDATDTKPAVRKLFWFELQQDGLHVRPFRSRRKRERVWPLAKLANGAAGAGQMNLFV